jgi:hypothetical protein
MPLKLPKIYFWFLIILLAVSNQACGPTQKNSQDTIAPAQGTQPPLVASPASSTTPTAMPIATQTINVTPAPTIPSVTVTAVKGNLFIRRGPDLAFDAVSVLTDGQSAQTLARDVLSKWLQVQVPDDPEKTGWISIQSHYTLVSGDVTNLPEVAPTDWPVLAFLQNCTHHLMEADPGGILIPAVDNFQENYVQLNPGIYTIYDIEVNGKPEVMQVEIKEGSEIDIREDGNGEHRKCPAA